MAEAVLNADERKVKSAFIQGEYEEAQRVLAEAGDNIRPVYRAIFQASIAFAAEDMQGAWKAIAGGLRLDNHNYELYMMLGDYYASYNLQQTYLCYENALFYCDVPEDREQICLVLDNLLKQGICVPKAAIVILSYNLLDMTKDCIESIRATTPDSAREIIVIDNASADKSVDWLKRQTDIKLLCNSENKGFPAACNQGIELADKDSDIFLLNNDTVMLDNALFWLRMGLYESDEVGCAGSVTNHISNFQTIIEDGKTRQAYLDFAKRVNVPMEKPYLNKLYLVGFSLLLKRTVLNQIGLLDERFTPGNFEDNDICLRINLAGYRNVLCKNSFIIHWGSKSFGKEPHKFNNVLEINQTKFFEKWSSIQLEPAGYWNIRLDLVSMLEKRCSISDSVIMVVGTGCGAFLSCLRDKFPNAQIYGMEQHQYMAQIADRISETVWVDLDEWKGDDLSDTFDIIIVNDSLEYTRKPGTVLAELSKMLKKDGQLFLSFVNSKHYSRIVRQNDSGRFFDRSQVSEMLLTAKLDQGAWAYTQIEDMTPVLEARIRELQNKYFVADKADLLAYQWITVVSKRSMVNKKESLSCHEQMGEVHDMNINKVGSTVQDRKMPLVSVVMPCYNHAKYVGYAIESILNQTYPNIELIVADNGCTDNSFEVIDQYRDKIKILRLEKNNQGLCGEMLLQAVTGEYYAVATSDDVWAPEKIELQMEAFFSNSNLQVCFTWALYADENMEVYSEQKNNVFLVKNRSRQEWFKRFIYCGNCLCYPSALYKTDLAKKFMDIRRGYVQLGDFWQWISIIQKGDIYIVERPMVIFRWHTSGNNRNESAPSRESIIRTNQEYAEIVLRALEAVDDVFFRETFKDEFIHSNAQNHDELLCEKFFLLKRMARNSYLFSDNVVSFYREHYLEMAKILESEYGFSYENYRELSAHSGLACASMKLDSLKSLSDAQREYAGAYVQIAQELAKMVYSDRFEKNKACAIFRRLPESEKTNLRTLYQLCKSALKLITEKVTTTEELYNEHVSILLNIYQLMYTIRKQTKLLGIMCDDDEFQLFGELLQLGEKNRIDFSEAVIPYIQIITEQLGEIMD